jgi:hypothetical protein
MKDCYIAVGQPLDEVEKELIESGAKNITTHSSIVCVNGAWRLYQLRDGSCLEVSASRMNEPSGTKTTEVVTSLLIGEVGKGYGG